MSTLFYGVMRDGVPGDSNVVRMTTAPYNIDAPPAEQQNPPEQGEVETDSNPDLGLVNRQLASDWHPAAYPARPDWLDRASDQSHIEIINDQVASSGTAAARESAGTFGHGTIPYANGIEPQHDLTDGGKLGNDYFVRNERMPMEGMDYDVQPTIVDNDTRSAVMADGKNATRDASIASLYQAFYSASIGGN